MATIRGNNSANTLTGTTLADLIYANGGNDVVNAGDGDDVVYGGNGSDRLNGGNGQDFLSGDAGNDTLNGDAGDDILMGGAGADILIGGTGDDYLDGGMNIDRAIFTGTLSDYLITLKTDGSYQFQDLRVGVNDGTDTLLNIENIQFSTETIALSSIQISLFSNGNDAINFNHFPLSNIDSTSIYDARDGNDIVTLSNTLQLSSTITYDITRTFSAGNGNDVINDASELGYKIDGGLGSDTVSFEGQSGRVVVSFVSGTVTKANGAVGQLLNIEEVKGSAFNDAFTGSTTAGYKMFGLGGNDDFKVSRFGGDVIDGGDGVDSIQFLTAAAPMRIDMTTNTAVSLDGLKTYTFYNVEIVKGGLFGDTIIGDGQDTVFVDVNGVNQIDGGEGIDTLNYLNEDLNAVTVDLTQSKVISSKATNTVTNIEKFITGNANDTLIGDGNNNYLDGSGGNDLFKGSLGNDTLIGGSGIDTLSYDTLSFNSVVINNRSKQVDKMGDSGYFTDTYSGIEKFTGTASHDIFFASSTESSEFNAGSGHDLIIDSIQDDVYVGGDGNDIFQNLTGQNTVDGGLGIDSIDYRYPTFTDPKVYVKFELNIGKVTAYGDANMTTVLGVTQFSSIENFYGSQENDIFYGSANFEYVVGGGGDDIFSMGAGNDFVDAGDGNDYIFDEIGLDNYFGGNGEDTVNFGIFPHNALDIHLEQGYATELVSLTGEYNVLNSIEHVVGTGFDDVITGNAEANHLNGNLGNDIINGGLGDDVIVGSYGNDVLTGGQGNDVFSVNASSVGHDIITDFEVGSDKIQFDNGLNYQYSQLQFQQTVDGLLITLDSALNDGTSLMLNGVSSVSESDFIF